MRDRYEDRPYAALTAKSNKIARNIVTEAIVSTPAAFAVPDPKTKNVQTIWDTGATNTVISYELANNLELTSH